MWALRARSPSGRAQETHNTYLKIFTASLPLAMVFVPLFNRCLARGFVFTFAVSIALGTRWHMMACGLGCGLACGLACGIYMWDVDGLAQNLGGEIWNLIALVPVLELQASAPLWCCKKGAALIILILPRRSWPLWPTQAGGPCIWDSPYIFRHLRLCNGLPFESSAHNLCGVHGF